MSSERAQRAQVIITKKKPANDGRVAPNTGVKVPPTLTAKKHGGRVGVGVERDSRQKAIQHVRSRLRGKIKAERE